jgi:hypothetical protein
MAQPFVYQYIVPQMILQVSNEHNRVWGIRFFSTQCTPDREAVRGTANYVFPKNPYSQCLKNISNSPNQCSGDRENGTLRPSAFEKESVLNAMPNAPI